MTLEENLRKLAIHASSVMLTYSEVSKRWECSLYVNGRSFCEFDPFPTMAVVKAREACERETGENLGSRPAIDPDFVRRALRRRQ